MTTSLRHDRPHRNSAAGRGRSKRPSHGDLPPTLLQLFDALDRGGIAWALIRPWEGLLSTEGDVDILVSERDANEVRKIVLSAGFLEMRSGGSGFHAVSFDAPSGRFLWVHVQYALKMGGVAIPADRLLGDVRREPLPEIAPDWLMWALLLRAIEKGHVPQRYHVRLRRLAADWSGGPADIEQLLKDRGIDPASLVGSAAAGDWDDIVSRSWPAARNQRPAVISRSLGAGRRIGSLFSFKSRGLCVAVIGPDGAGKSTLVEGLQKTLPFRTRRIYMGLTGGRMRRAQLLRVPGLVFAAQSAVLWARYLQALLRSADGQIVLFERYVLDGAVSAGTPLSALQRFSRRVQRWIVPPADLVLLLDASGRTMFGRKGEYSSGTLESWRAQYRKLESSVPNLVVIDAEQTADDVLKTAQAAIWSRLRRRAAA